MLNILNMMPAMFQTYGIKDITAWAGKHYLLLLIDVLHSVPTFLELGLHLNVDTR